MNSDYQPSVMLPAMIQAGAAFIILALVGLMAYGFYLEIYSIVKLVVLAAILSYISQVCFCIMEDARQLGRAIPNIIALAAWASYTWAVVLVAVAVIIMLVR